MKIELIIERKSNDVTYMNSFEFIGFDTTNEEWFTLTKSIEKNFK
jgi:hypothetical protein